MLMIQFYDNFYTTIVQRRMAEAMNCFGLALLSSSKLKFQNFGPEPVKI